MEFTAFINIAMGCTQSLQPETPRFYAEGAPRSVQHSLVSIDPDSVPKVIYQDIPIDVYIYDVHDGDTVHFIMKVGGTPVKLALRLIGIDTPEIRTGVNSLPEEKLAGVIARNRLASIIKSTDRSLTTIIIRDWDKFGGRVLGEIVLPDGRSVAEILIKEGYGRKYNGEKKERWTKEDLSAEPFLL